MRSYRKQYLIAIVLVSLLLIVATYYSSRPISLSLLSIPANILIFAYFHHKVKLWKEDLNLTDTDPVKADIIISRSRGKVIKSILPYYLIPLTINILTFILIAVNWDKLGDQVPTHWGPYGADVFAPKTWKTAYSSAYAGLLITGIFLLVNLTVIWMKQDLRMRSDDAVSALRQARKAWTVYSLVVASVMSLSFLLMAVDMVRQYTFPAWFYTSSLIIMMVVIIVGMFYVGIKYGISGERYQKNDEVGYQDDDEYWKFLGNLYYNPDDPAFIVPKRVGLGTTVNFAHPAGKVMMVALIAVIIWTIYIVGKTGL